MNGLRITGDQCMKVERPRGFSLAAAWPFRHTGGMFGRGKTARPTAPVSMAQAPGSVNPERAAGAEYERLGALLVSQGHCDAKTLERARGVAAETGQRLDSVLIQLGLVSERGLAEALAGLLNLPLAGVEHYPTDPLLTEQLTAKFLRQARAVPLALSEGTLRLAMANPLDRFTQAAVASAAGLPVAPEVAVPIELEAALARLYPDIDAAEAGAEPRPGDGASLHEDTERLKDLASEAPVIRLVNQLIARAVETQASDIHIEPFEDRLRVRYRYDGVLHEAESPPARLAAAIISRIKIMARLDIAERRLPQDGRIRWPCAARTSISASPRFRPCTGRRWCCACSTAPPSCSIMTGWACRPISCSGWRRRSDCPTASCW